IYLSPDPESDTWGTAIYEGPGPETYLATVPFKSNRGLIFLPGEDTWHGFRKRPINGIRRALIVNYVSDEWRARHELCFPESRIG
ncbi:MAG: 2OG-Fe(II) oxygenase, partial [Rhodospirillales bacterium]|nr:2OG-Fe(II) oxygenase [Rhodospirillales bacterium]